MTDETMPDPAPGYEWQRELDDDGDWHAAEQRAWAAAAQAAGEAP